MRLNFLRRVQRQEQDGRVQRFCPIPVCTG